MAALLDAVGALRWADLVLQSQLAVRWLPSTLTVRCPFLGLEFFDSHGTKLMDVAAAKARTVRTVPVLFHDHGTTAAGTNSGRSGLHRYFEPPFPWPDRPEARSCLAKQGLGRHKKAFCQ